MKKFKEPKIELYTLMVKDKLTNNSNGDDPSDVLPEDEFEE